MGIKSRAENLLPKWLRFAKGVVDSEDIPLNLSRELLQDSSLIRKLRQVLTNRMLRYLRRECEKSASPTWSSTRITASSSKKASSPRQISMRRRRLRDCSDLSALPYLLARRQVPPS